MKESLTTSDVYLIVNALSRESVRHEKLAEDGKEAALNYHKATRLDDIAELLSTTINSGRKTIHIKY